MYEYKIPPVKTRLIGKNYRPCLFYDIIVKTLQEGTLMTRYEIERLREEANEKIIFACNTLANYVYTIV